MLELSNHPRVAPDSISDKQLLLDFVNGDETAFQRIIERHAYMVRSVCFRILRNSSDCEDAFQATFFALASRAKVLAGQDSVGGWLHQVARRVSLKLRSKVSKRRSLEASESSELEDPAYGPMDHIGVRELGEILDSELARLPRKFREVFLLTQVEGLSRSEAAARLGITPGAVKDRLERGRALLQMRLTRKGITLSAAVLAAWLCPGTTQAATLPTWVAQTGPLAVSFAAGKMIGVPMSASVALAQWILKVTGMQKIAAIFAIVVSMITGGSIALAVLQDHPNRFDEGLRGTVVHLQNGTHPTLTLELDEYNARLDLDVSSSVRVWIAYEASEFGKLKTGQYVAVQLESDNRTIKEIHAQGAIREATLIAVTNGNTLIVEANDDQLDRKPESIEISSDAILRIGGIQADRSDLLPGMSLPLEFGPDKHKVHAIESEADETLIIEGELTLVDPNTQELTLAIETEDDQFVARTLVMDDAVIITRNSERLRVEDLSPGDLLKLRLSADKTTIRSLKLLARENREPPTGRNHDR